MGLFTWPTETVMRRFTAPAASGSRDVRSSANLLAALELCCEMHLGEPATALTAEPQLAPLLGETAASGTSAPIDRSVVLGNLRALRAPADERHGGARTTLID